MISSISSSSAATAVHQQYSAAQDASSQAKSNSTPEDTVQLSSQTQQQLKESEAKPKTQQPQTINAIIKEAADGDITAFAKLALVG